VDPKRLKYSRMEEPREAVGLIASMLLREQNDYHNLCWPLQIGKVSLSREEKTLDPILLDNIYFFYTKRALESQLIDVPESPRLHKHRIQVVARWERCNISTRLCSYRITLEYTEDFSVAAVCRFLQVQVVK
jgi:hypothetical protein